MSVNLQYNTLVRWANWTNDSSTKRLMFQVWFFFHKILQNSLQKHFLFMFSFFCRITKMKIKSFECSNADHIWLERLVLRVKARDFKASDLAKLSLENGFKLIILSRVLKIWSFLAQHLFNWKKNRSVSLLRFHNLKRWEKRNQSDQNRVNPIHAAATASLHPFSTLCWSSEVVVERSLITGSFSCPRC